VLTDAGMSQRQAAEALGVSVGTANMEHGGDRKSDQAAELPVEISQASAAAMLNVSERSLRVAKAVMTAPDLAESRPENGRESSTIDRDVAANAAGDEGSPAERGLPEKIL
jgi:transcriptional regulator with XRE-family HTH domain